MQKYGNPLNYYIYMEYDSIELINVITGDSNKRISLKLMLLQAIVLSSISFIQKF